MFECLFFRLGKSEGMVKYALEICMKALKKSTEELGKVTGLVKRSSEVKVAVLEVHAKQTDAKAKNAKPKRSVQGWNRGTGFGHGGSSYNWDVQSFQQAASDGPISEVL